MSKRSRIATMRKYYYSDNPRAPLKVHRAEVPLMSQIYAFTIPDVLEQDTASLQFGF